MTCGQSSMVTERVVEQARKAVAQMGKGELAEEVERSQLAHADWGEGRTWHDRTRDWREMCYRQSPRGDATSSPGARRGVVHHKSDRGAYASAELIIVPACEDFTIVGGGAQECYTRK